jgi:hypothetical protein
LGGLFFNHTYVCFIIPYVCLTLNKSEKKERRRERKKKEERKEEKIRNNVGER